MNIPLIILAVLNVGLWGFASIATLYDREYSISIAYIIFFLIETALFYFALID